MTRERPRTRIRPSAQAAHVTDARVKHPSLCAALVATTLLAGCASTKAQPGGRLSPSEQVLASEAVDRAVERLEWPDVDGERVFLSVAAPSGDPEKLYLQNAITAELVERGAVLAPDAESARYAVLVLADAVGVEETSAFFGLPATQSALIPIGLPEIALYDSSRARGYARVEVVLTDLKQGGIVGRSGPVAGETYLQKRKILLFGSEESDTPEAKALAD